MSAAPDTDGAAPSHRRSARRRVAIAFGGLGAAALVGTWLARVPIATGFIDRELAAKGVAARYTVANLGFGRQRLTNVVLGDPKDPDLVADWVETQTDLGLSGASLAGVRAGHVRLRARLVDGHVSLGAIDRLLPPPSGKPFALPALFASVEDARIRLETPGGLVGIKLAGNGKLDGGFRGRLAAVAPTLTAGGCTLSGTTATLRIAIDTKRPTLAGPLHVDTARCGATTLADATATIDATLAEALDRWRGSARLDIARAGTPTATARALAGTLTFAGSVADTRGRVDLAARDARAGQGRAARVAIAGDYRLGAQTAFAGHIRVSDATTPALAATVARTRGVGVGTPVAPLAARIGTALAAAARRFDLDADIAWQAGMLTIPRAALASASGARAALAGGTGLTVAADGLRLDATATLNGGGLPSAQVALSQPRPGAPLTGTAIVAPYMADGARLALIPVRFTIGDRAMTRIATTATLSGPLGDGRVDALSLPIDARLARGGALTINPACTPLSFDRVALSGLDLRGIRLALCPIDGALVRVTNGAITGGARIATPRLAGTLGGSPVTLAATDATLRLGSRGFTIDGLAARLGPNERQTKLDIATLAGSIDATGLAGSFASAAGRIGAVPLLLADASGAWSFASGRLALTGSLGVSDAQTDAPRFRPLAARDVALTLEDGAITATGTLVEPKSTRKVADVTIAHRLSTGTGSADLVVPGITFDDTLQPDALTPVTFGVIADVKGEVHGRGRIDWTPQGVTSTGRFATAVTDLAAAFGPVTGIAGEIAFTDLLALESAPAQVATIRTVNPGIPVSDGRIVYQTYAGARVLVNGGRWPFAGGVLTLDPTLLDFSSPKVRRMTFHVEGMDAGKFLQQFDFDNLTATGTFDGVLPMLFDESGGRIEGGTLIVRDGGGTLAYVGDLTQKDLGVWGNLAFQALKSLRYRSLGIEMNGPLAGEMVTGVRFAGISQGTGAKSNFLIRRLQRLPFVFNVTIRAPFRGLLDSARSFYDPTLLIQRNLQPLLREQQRRAGQPAPPVQPPASETVP